MKTDDYDWMFDAELCGTVPTVSINSREPDEQRVYWIREVLLRYFEKNPFGDKLPNEYFDPDFSAQEALDEIVEILNTEYVKK